MSTIDATLAERGSRYGEFDEHARVTQNIKAAFGDSKNWNFLDDDQKECLEMIAHKAGRILNGDPDYVDSWTDIIGYTRLVEKRLITQSTAEGTQGFVQAGAQTGAQTGTEGSGCDDPNCPVCAPAGNGNISIIEFIAAALRKELVDRGEAEVNKRNVET